MKLVRVVHGLSLVLSLASFACEGGELARVSQPGEVAGCKPLGEVVVDTDPDKYQSNDKHVLELRQKAASAGATNVVSEPGGADGMTMKGQMYKCADHDKSVTRAEERAGF